MAANNGNVPRRKRKTFDLRKSTAAFAGESQKGKEREKKEVLN